MKPTHHATLESTAIRSASWWSDRKLAVTFTSGKTYEFVDVPETVYRGLVAAESAGRYFATYIKGRFQPAENGAAE